MIVNMKLLVLGGSGLIGYSIIKKTVGIFDILSTYNKNKIDIGRSVKLLLANEPTKVNNLIEQESPDLVIHAAGYSNVDFCEENQLEAHKLHVKATEIILKACKRMNSKLIYISTEYVFDGKKGHFRETDPPNPLNYYGKSKLQAEKIVLTGNNDNTVLRTSVIYGSNPKGRFLNFVLENLRKSKEFFVYSDQYCNPTLIDDLINSIVKIIKIDAKGIYHTVGSSCLSRYQFARLIGKQFGYNVDLIKPILTADLPQICKRPLMNCLDNSKAKNDLKIKFSTVEEGLSKIKGGFQI